jgi:polyphosphate kinase
MLIRAGIILSKYWFSVNGEEQERRFEKRMSNEMFEQTDTKNSPWYVVNADTKKRARLNCIAHLLSQIPCHDMTPVQVPWRPRPSILYKRPKMSTQSLFLKFTSEAPAHEQTRVSAIQPIAW